MLDIIQLLPDSIANQIAAGEVVQRPASIVKELMENSIDAQSKSIKLIIKDSGKTLVQVIDDGIGMSETDARLSFERHATSKIRKTEDLFNIQSMGFRGEALASIAAVAQVELKTKRPADDLGTMICIEGSKLKTQETVSCPSGTSIAVKNVFFNVPARRNFLKSNQVEMRHILDEFHRIALAHPDIDFLLFHNDLEVYNLSAGKLSNRIVHIFGKHYQKQLAFCQEELPLLTIKGYIGKPEYARKTRGEQFFFVNKRYIRHAYLNHAVLTAFEGLIPADTFPFYVLFLEIDPIHIDINIHPTKTEVKFDDERTIYALLASAIKKTLSIHNLSPALDFEMDVNFDMSAGKEITFKENNLYQGLGSQNPFEKSPQEKRNLKNWDILYESFKKNTPEENPDFENNTEKEDFLTLESKANQIQKDSLFAENPFQSKERNIFQIHYTYLLTQVKSGLMIVHQRAAFERILYDKYLQALDKKAGVSQQSLFPVIMELNAGDFQLILEIEPEIRNLGFVFDILADNKILLKGAPPDTLDNESEKELFEGFIEQIKNAQADIKNDRNQSLARMLAKRAAAKLQTYMNKIEMNALIDQLFASANPNYAPDGKLILVILNLDKIANFFEKPNIPWETI